MASTTYGNGGTHVPDLENVEVEERDTSQLPSAEEMRSRSSFSVGVGDDTGKRKRSLTIFGIVVLSVLLVAVIVGVVVGVTRPRGDKGAATRDPLSAEYLKRAEDISNFVIDEGLSDEVQVLTAGTPQNLAVAFMAVGDDAQMEVPLSRTDDGAFQFIQRYVLAVYYYSLGGPEWKFNLNFMTPDASCLWYQKLKNSAGQEFNFGAQCGNTGEVDRLFMVGNSLKGTLPTEVGLLTALTFLAAPANGNITGPLPDTYQQLTNLELVDFGVNQITGNVPSWIGDLSSLSYLSLKDNQLKGTIPDSIGDLTQLYLLALDGNILTGEITPVNRLTSLTYLYLESNALDQTLDENTLKDLVALEQLDLSDNSFSGTLPVHLLELPSLAVLDLHNNLLVGNIPEEISPNDALNYLFIDGNSFSGSIPSSIQNLAKLNHLDMTNNQFTGEINSALGALTDMVYFFLADNQFFTPGPIPPFLTKMTSLRDLSLKNTRRTGPIPTWIDNLDRLLLLDLDNNGLSGAIPSEMGSMTNLGLLLLNRNNLNSTIPDEVENMSNLALLLLDKNDITGSAASACRAQNLQQFIADCGGANPEISCECCTTCCKDSDDTCNDEGLLAQFNPIWEEGYERRFYEFSDDLVFRPVPAK